MNADRKKWLIDLGNSRLKGASIDAQGARGDLFAIGHDQPDSLPALLQHLRQGAAADEAWLASVASAERTIAVTETLERAGLSVRRIQTQAQCGKLRVAYPEPVQLGVDRFLALLAAVERNDGPWLIVSAGSALTIDLLGVDGGHLGGMIAPMPGAMREVLSQQFAQLDLPEGKAHDFADNTADAIASGARAAVLGLVERALRSGRERLGATPTLLVCGGDAALLADVDHPRVVNLPALVLDGMALFVRGMER